MSRTDYDYESRLPRWLRYRKSWMRDVADFNLATGHSVEAAPTIPDDSTIDLRLRLLREELAETIEAMDDHDMAGIADGLADLIYVAIGTALAYGIDLDRVWAEVHRTNMAKVGGPVVNGKQLKPDGWQPPDIEGALREQVASVG